MEDYFGLGMVAFFFFFFYGFYVMKEWVLDRERGLRIEEC